MADKVKPELPAVAAPENATIGDENLEVREPSVEVNKDSVPAQTTGKPAVEVDTVRVHEVAVVTDEIITDPHSPLAVQIPDAGRGSLDLPIHRLDAPTVEQVFAAHAAESEEKSEEDASDDDES